MYETSVYTKMTNDGGYINFKSNCPEHYKVGVIKTLLHRAFLISSTWQSFTAELTRIKQTLINNNFPLSLVDKIIKNFLDTKFRDETRRNENFPVSRPFSKYSKACA